MFEYGFLRLIKLTNHVQISQFPQIIQQVVRKIKSPFVSIRCWSTLPQWDGSNWMTVQPSHHLVLIDGYTHKLKKKKKSSYHYYLHVKYFEEFLLHIILKLFLNVKEYYVTTHACAHTHNGIVLYDL